MHVLARPLFVTQFAVGMQPGCLYHRSFPKNQSTITEMVNKGHVQTWDSEERYVYAQNLDSYLTTLPPKVSPIAPPISRIQPTIFQIFLS